MNLFGLKINITRSHSPQPAPAQKSFDPADWVAGRDLDYIRPATFQNPFVQHPWVYRAVSVIAEQIANIPFVFSHGARGRENLITSGPLIQFYNQPAPNLTRFAYWYQRVLWLMLRGECFRIPIFESSSSSLPSIGSAKEGSSRSTPDTPPPVFHSAGYGRRLRSVLILNPDNFQHVIQNGKLDAWRYTARGPEIPLDEQVFLHEEVWFEKLDNPFDYWRGIAPLYVANVAARTDFAASAFMRGYMENNADNGLIIRTDAQLTEEQREQMAAGLRRRKRSAGTADQSVLLWGATEIIKPTLSSADLQFLENRKFSRAEICATFGVPEEIVCTTDHNKYDVMQGARLNFIENTIAPLCARLEASEQITVQAIDPKAVGWFDLDSLPIMQKARRDRVATAKTAFDMGVPFNDINRIFDLGFKPLPWGNDGFVSSSLQKLSSSLPSIGSEKEGAAQSASTSVSLSATGGPQNAERSSLDGQLTGGGLGKSLGRGEVVPSSSIFPAAPKSDVGGSHKFPPFPPFKTAEGRAHAFEIMTVINKVLDDHERTSDL